MDHRTKGNRLQYSSNDLTKAIDIIENGELTIKEVSIAHNIPYKTLLKKFHGQTLETQIGRPSIFTLQDLADMRVFVMDRSILGCPLTLETFLDQLQVYCKYYGIGPGFKDYRPGRWWVKRFLQEANSMFRFATDAEVHAASCARLSIKDWYEWRKPMIRMQNDGDLINKKARCYIAVSGCLPTLEKENVQVVLTFNGNGATLSPFLMYKGPKDDQLEKDHKDRLCVRSSSDGRADVMTVDELIEAIDIHAETKKLEYPIVIYLSPDLAQKLCWITHVYILIHNILVLPIPQSIYDHMQSANLDFFQALSPTFMKLLIHRCASTAMKHFPNDLALVLQQTMATFNARKMIGTLLSQYQLVEPGPQFQVTNRRHISTQSESPRQPTSTVTTASTSKKPSSYMPTFEEDEGTIAEIERDETHSKVSIGIQTDETSMGDSGPTSGYFPYD